MANRENMVNRMHLDMRDIHNFRSQKTAMANHVNGIINTLYNDETRQIESKTEAEIKKIIEVIFSHAEHGAWEIRHHCVH